MASKKAQQYISKKISKLSDEGYDDPKQRLAIAYSYARKKGYKVPNKKKTLKQKVKEKRQAVTGVKG